MALAVIILLVNLLLSNELIAPSPNISGTVPKLNASIDKAPCTGSPVERA
jgi:hypothetical protein